MNDENPQSEIVQMANARVPHELPQIFLEKQQQLCGRVPEPTAAILLKPLNSCGESQVIEKGATTNHSQAPQRKELAAIRQASQAKDGPR